MFKRFDVKIAYKINDVQTTFEGIEKIVPLLPERHALFNVAYATNFEKWTFDVTANYIGRSRIPSHVEIKEEFSQPFNLYNAQIKLQETGGYP